MSIHEMRANQRQERTALLLLLSLSVSVTLPACSSTHRTVTLAPYTGRPIPETFDLSATPKRPPLEWTSPTRTVVRLDPGTGYGFRTVRDTTALKGIPPDTNDAHLYYAAGVDAIRTDPSLASAAFYWASRLDPSWADPYFARWYTLRTAADEDRPRRIDGRVIKRRITLPDSVRRRIDSLILQAYVRNPFVDEQLAVEGPALLATYQVAMAHNGRHISSKLTWYGAFAMRDWATAARMLRAALDSEPSAIGLYVYRAESQFYLTQYDSCAATLRAAIARIDEHDPRDTLRVYRSKEMFTYAIAIAEDAAGNDTGARTAYRQTVSENDGFAMAHLHLANRAMARQDTATAIVEAIEAAEIQSGDADVELNAGYALLQARRLTDAIVHLHAAVRIDPQYALASLYLGQALSQHADTAGALAAYRDYLARSRRDDAERATVEQAITVLGGALPARQ